MKIDRKKTVNKCGYDQEECIELAQRLARCSDGELMTEIRRIKVWNYGKCELGLWSDVLDRLDSVLEYAVTRVDQWTLRVDSPGHTSLVNDVIAILEFTGHLIEHSIYRYLYGSLDHILLLFCSANMDIVLAVLGLFYTFSKRSNYFNRVGADIKKDVSVRLEYLAESWGGKENGFDLAHCCNSEDLPKSASSLYYEYYQVDKSDSTEGSTPLSATNRLIVIKKDSIGELGLTPCQIMEDLLKEYQVPTELREALFTRVRLAAGFSEPKYRHKCLKARLQALSILCYAFEVDERNMYAGLLEELIDVLQLPESSYSDIKASALRTMTAIVHSGRLPLSWPLLMETTGLSNYHGILPNLVRRCVSNIVEGVVEASSGSVVQQYTTALLSFLYHLACYVEAERSTNQQRLSLLSSGVMDSMLQLVSWQSSSTDHLSFATRAVRVTDQILHSVASQQETVINALVSRLNFEVRLCCPSVDAGESPSTCAEPGGATCGAMMNSQRAGLIKSILNLLKRLCQETDWIDSLRQAMDYDLPGILRNIFLQPQHFTPQLALFATEVVTNYIYHIPSQISHMQEKGLTDEILKALTSNPLPQNREFLYHLPQILNVLALNARGIEGILNSKVIDRFVNTLISPDYVSTMRQRRMRGDANSGLVGGRGAAMGQAVQSGTGTTASQMGFAMEELIRGHGQLRPALFTALVEVLQKLVAYGKEAAAQPSSSALVDLLRVASHLQDAETAHVPVAMEEGISDDEEDNSCAQAPLPPTVRAHVDAEARQASVNDDTMQVDDQTPTTSSRSQPDDVTESGTGSVDKRGSVESPLNRNNLNIYLLNVCKFLESLLVSVNNHESHCRHFINLNGVIVLVQLIQIPALPVDFYNSQACQSINKIVQSLCNSAEFAQIIFNELLKAMQTKLNEMQVFNTCNYPMHSILLKDHLSNCRDSSNSTIVQNMMITSTLCDIIEQAAKNCKPEIKNTLISRLIESGLMPSLGQFLLGVSWETSVLLKLLCEDTDICREDLEQLALSSDRSAAASSNPSTFRLGGQAGTNSSDNSIAGSTGSLPPATEDDRPTTEGQQQQDKPSGMQSLESLHIYAIFKKNKKTTGPPPLSSFPDLEKVVKRLLLVSTLLVKAGTDLATGWMTACTGGNSALRSRRQNHRLPNQRTVHELSTQLAGTLNTFLSWEAPFSTRQHPASPKLVYTMYYSAVSFTNVMLFDANKIPYLPMIEAFYFAGGVDTYFELFTKLIEKSDIAQGVPPDNSSIKGCLVLVLEEWLRCAERMSNTQNIMEETQRNVSTTPRSRINIVNCLKAIRKQLYQPMAFLCVNQNVQSLLTQTASESMLTILQSLAPLVFERPEPFMTESDMKAASESSASTSKPATSTHNPLSITRTGGGGDLSSTPSVPPDPPPRDNVVPTEGASGGVANGIIEGTSASRPGGFNQTDSDTIRLFMEMGFPMRHVINALEENGWNRDEAANQLLMGIHDIPMEEARSLTDTPRQPVTSTRSGLGPRGFDPTAEGSGRTTGQWWQQSTIPPSLGDLDGVGSKDAGPGTNDETKRQAILAAKESLKANMFQGCLAIAKRHANKVILNTIADIILMSGEEERFITSLLTRDDSDSAIVMGDSTSETSGEGSTKEALDNINTLNIISLLFTRTRTLMAQLAHKFDVPNRLLRLMSGAGLNACRGTQLTLICLILDQYERTTKAIELRREMVEAYDKCHTWLWFDDKSAVWHTFNPTHNKTVDKTFHDGQLSCGYTAHQQRPYTVNLPTMSQVNVESQNRRPLLLLPQPSTQDNAERTKYEKETLEMPPVPSLSPEQRDILMHLLIGQLAWPIESDTLNAVLRLALRLAYTDYTTASKMLDLGLVEQLFDFTYPKSFTAYPGFVGTLIRQLFEDKALVRKCMEQVMTQLVERGVACPYLGVQLSNVGCRDLFYLVGMMTPMFAKDRDICTELMQQMMFMTVDDKWVKEGALSKCNFMLKKDVPKPPKEDTAFELNDRQKALLNHLLEYIAQPSTKKEESPAKSKVFPTFNPSNDPANSNDSMDVTENTPKAPDTAEDTTTSDDKSPAAAATEDTRIKLGKPDCFKFLTEFIFSYQSVAEYVARYRYPLTGESALAYFLENFLDNADTGELCTALLEAVAKVNPDTQTIFVTELKASINKTANFPDTVAKNSKLSAHMKLIDKVLVQPYSYSAHLNRQMYKRQLPCDLAKLPALIDLNIPGSTATVTLIVKTLENLTKVERQTVKKPQQQNTTAASGNRSYYSVTRETNSLPRQRHPAGIYGEDYSSGDDDNEVHDRGALEDQAIMLATSALEGGQMLIAREEEENEAHRETISVVPSGSVVVTSEEPMQSTDDGDTDHVNHDERDIGGNGIAEEVVGDVISNEIISYIAADGEMEDGDGMMILVDQCPEGEDEGEDDDVDIDDVDDDTDEDDDNDDDDDDDDDVDDVNDEIENFEMHYQEEEAERERGPLEDDAEVIATDDDDEDDSGDDNEGSDGQAGDDIHIEHHIPIHLDHVDMIEDDFDSFEFEDDDEAPDARDREIHLIPNTLTFSQLLGEAPIGNSFFQVANAGGQDNLILQLPPSHTWDRQPATATQPDRAATLTTQHPLLQPLNVRYAQRRHFDFLRMLRSQFGIQLNNGPVPNMPGNRVGQNTLEGDLTVWELLSDEDTRADAYPTNYRRWVELSRLLHGRELMDMMLIARRTVFDYAQKIRENEFEVAVKAAQEATKKQAAAQKSKPGDSKTDSGASYKPAGVSSLSRPSNSDRDQGSSVLSTSLSELIHTAVTPSDILNEVESLLSSTSTMISNALRQNSSSPSRGQMDSALSANNERNQPAALEDILQGFDDFSDAPVDPVNEEEVSGEATPMDTDAPLRPLPPPPSHDTTPPPPAVEEAVSIAESSAPEVSTTATAPTTSSASSSAVATTEATGGDPMNAAIQSMIAEGMDPSFLEALPEEMRREVIADHMRARRVQQQLTTTELPEEINPEVLATLPPSIQEEVLAQYRRPTRIASPPPEANQPVDNISFLASLPASLRREVLADMEDSQLDSLPQDLATEARQLRAENEQRYSRLLHERNLARESLQNFVSGHHRQIIAGNFDEGISSTRYPMRGQIMRGVHRIVASIKGKQLIDHEGLTCVIVLLITSSGSAQRRPLIAHLRKVLSNVSYHHPTRQWIVSTLISILRELTLSPLSPIQQAEAKDTSCESTGSNLIEVGFEAALGCRVRFLYPHRSRVKGEECRLKIHPQAAPLVCRVVLETLSELTRPFLTLFFPPEDNSNVTSEIQTDFWDHVFQLSMRPPVLHTMPTVTPSTTPHKKTQPQDTEAAATEASTPAVPTVNYFSYVADLVNHPVIQSRSEHLEKLMHIFLNIINEFVNHKYGMTTSTTARPVGGRFTFRRHRSRPSNGGLDGDEDMSLNAALIAASSALVSQPNTWTTQSASTNALRSTAGTTVTSSTSAPVPAVTVASESGEPPATASTDDATATDVKGESSTDATPTKSGDIMVPVSESVVQSLVQLIVDKFANAKVRTLSNQVLTQLSKANGENKQYTLVLLEEGLYSLSNQLSADLSAMIDEISSLPKKAITAASDEEGTSDSHQLPSTSGYQSHQQDAGLLQDRFGAPGEYVVVTGSTKPKPIAFSELRLDSLEPFTAPKSIQLRFLKVLTLMNSISSTSLASLQLGQLWELVSRGLNHLEQTSDPNAVLLLQPVVEAFCLAHAHTGNIGGSATDDEKDKKPEAAPTTSTAVDGGAGSSSTPAAQASSSGGATGQSSSSTASRVKEELAHLDLDMAGPASPGPASQDTKSTPAKPDEPQLEIVRFAEQHRTVLNQILRQQTSTLNNSAFAVLFHHPRVLDFDVKRRHFRAQLAASRSAQSLVSRDEELVVVTRGRIFEDSYTRLHRKTPDEWKRKFYITFQNEEGQDAGGLLREWYLEMSREIFDPNYCLFRTSPGDRVTYAINPASYVNSNHLSYFKFVGRFIAKAIYDNKLLECYFTRSFYKHILGVAVSYTDLESEDYEFYKGLDFLLENKVSDLGYELTFSTEINEFGKTEVRELLPNGSNVRVTEEDKKEYVRLVCQERMLGSIRQQINAFLQGFYDIIPKRLISIFNEQELELLISGLPNIDIDDLKANAEYQKYQTNAVQIQWFWRALRSFTQADRARFLQFVTGTSKVPLGGFANLEGMHGTQKFQIHRDSRSTDRLPTAHTCFNQLDLPAYETYEKLRDRLLKAVCECSSGFGFA